MRSTTVLVFTNPITWASTPTSATSSPSRANLARRAASQATLRLVGGPGYEAFIDGANLDGSTTAQAWLLTPSNAPALASRMKYLTGGWRSEFETAPPADADGVMLAAVSVGAQDAMLPVATLVQKPDGPHVQVTGAGHSVPVDIGFPAGAAPTLNGAPF